MSSPKQYETLYITEVDPATGYFNRPRYLFKNGTHRTTGRFPVNPEHSYAFGKETLAALNSVRAFVESDPSNTEVKDGTSEGFKGFRWRDAKGILHEVGVWSVWDYTCEKTV